ncbi:MAG: hypothetical protein MI922_09730 [Bacteroidales bacterium]|nr:hypothetical protein [Bacteroidales bacterium]
MEKINNYFKKYKNKKIYTNPMNIQGIKLLREFNLPSPEKEIITKDISNLDLEHLYKDAPHDMTIIAFDETEEINQSPFLEKNVRKYKIKKEEFFDILDNLTNQLLKKGVKKENIIYMIHQSYIPDTIIYSGRAGIYIDDQGHGHLAIEAVESLKTSNQDYNPTFSYLCPIKTNRVLRSEEKIHIRKFDLPNHITEQIIIDIIKISKSHKNPHIDFEVYSHNGKLFYHDMLLAHK